MSNNLKDNMAKKLFTACNNLRGAAPVSEYHKYIMIMMFIKFITDKSKADTVGDETQGGNENGAHEVIVPNHCAFDYIYENKANNNIAKIIEKAVYDLEEVNSDMLGNVLTTIWVDFDALGEAAISALISTFSDITLYSHYENISGIIFDTFIEKVVMESSRLVGEYHSPKGIAELVAKLTELGEGVTVYDPTCGAGTMLVSAQKQTEPKKLKLYGQEINQSTWALCKLNLIFHGVYDAQIELADTIRNPAFHENGQLMKFDKVIASPPLSVKNWGIEVAENDKFNRFAKWGNLPPNHNGDYAFIIHMIESLAEHGTAAVVVPHGVLFRGGNEKKLREKILKENLVDAVIALPANLLCHTAIAIAVIVLKKNRKQDDVLIIDASHDYLKGKRQNELRTEGADSDVSRIVDCYLKRNTCERYSACVTLETIEKNDFDLSVPTYVDSTEPAIDVNVSEMKAEISTLEKKLEVTTSRIDSLLTKLGT